MGTDILSSVVERTQSDLILFFIIFAVGAGAMMIPLLNYRKHWKQLENERLAHHSQLENARFDQIIKVIADNTTTQAALNSTMHELRPTLTDDRANFAKSLDRIHDRIDKQNSLLIQIAQKMGVTQ